ncbi:MAG: alpha-ketoacid dehydrogenase subunit beta [Chloroflexi bacterium]|nr:alpha-ketoacid dehydrogenase subunit beta [Chloroflexota bacterium]
MPELRSIDAIRDALRSELARDPRVVLLGEDITVGGPFGATKGLVDEFGEARVRNTPISEAAVMGLAVGAAATGMRPVVEVMFMDFITLAMDQLVNHAAKLRYMTGGQLRVPLTIRVQGGAAASFGAHHSQSLEAWLTHVPGLKVVAPATPADARGLLIAAIRDDDPVIFIEHRALYWTRGPVPDGHDPVPIGRAKIVRRGADVTVISYSRMVGIALEAATRLADEGLDVEVIDLRSLAPLDIDTLIDSARRTRRVVVAHEAVQHGGVGAEIAARIQAEAFGELDAPVLRVGAPFVPVPFSPELERRFVPDADDIAGAVRSTVRRPSAVPAG